MYMSIQRGLDFILFPILYNTKNTTYVTVYYYHYTAFNGSINYYFYFYDY